MADLTQQDYLALQNSCAPEDRQLASQLATGFTKLIGFWKERYLEEYIASGGSKIKFITGFEGCGKTTILRMLEQEALLLNYKVVNFSCYDVPIKDFSFVYNEIVKQCDLPACLQKCAELIIRDIGYEPAELPAGQSFYDYLRVQNLADVHICSEIKNILADMFSRNPFMDRDFAMACSRLTGGILGYPALDPGGRDLLVNWLNGELCSLIDLRKYGLSVKQITKYSARNMLRSLTEVLKMNSYRGLLVTVDDFDALLCRTKKCTIKYSKTAIQDIYEDVRGLIDSIDTMQSTMFVYAFNQILIDDDKQGIKTYDALWSRMRTEAGIVQKRCNFFADIINLDQYERQFFTVDTLLTMAAHLQSVMSQRGIQLQKLDSSKSSDILANAEFVQTGIPRTVYRYLQGGVKHV